MDSLVEVMMMKSIVMMMLSSSEEGVGLVVLGKSGILDFWIEMALHLVATRDLQETQEFASQLSIIAKAIE